MGRLSSPSQGKFFEGVFIEVKTILQPLAPDKLFSKTVIFQNSSKTVRDIENMYTITFVDLKICNNLVSMYILISRAVFEIQGYKQA